MTKELCSAIAEYIRLQCGYISKIGGQARIMQINDGGAKKEVPVCIPITCAGCGENTDDKEVVFGPDEKESGVLYMLVTDIQTQFMRAGYVMERASITVPVWLNGNMITEPDFVFSDLTAKLHRSTGRITSGAIGGKPTNIKIVSVRQDLNYRPSYGVDEKEAQYFAPPFYFFALVLDVMFTVSANCNTSPSVKTSVC